MVGMVINLIVGVYIPIIRIPIKGGMTIPNTRSLDPSTYGFPGVCVFFKASRIPSPKKVREQKIPPLGGSSQWLITINKSPKRIGLWDPFQIT